MKNEFHVRTKKKEYHLVFNDGEEHSGSLNGNEFSLDLCETKTGFHILDKGKAYIVDVISVDPNAKKVELRINQKYYVFEVKDRYDNLLETLGMDMSSARKVNEIKAPMPGLVLEVLVNPGDEVEVDQPLVILEAMKMENVIKSPANSKVRNVEVTKGDSVEKNQILVGFN